MNRVRLLPAAKRALDELASDTRADVLLRMDALADLVRLASSGQTSWASLGLELPGTLHTVIGSVRVSYEIDAARGELLIVSVEPAS